MNRCLSPELIRSSKYLWMSAKRSFSSPWSRTTACKRKATEKEGKEDNYTSDIKRTLENKSKQRSLYKVK